MLLADFSTVPGFGDIGEGTHCGSKVFQSAENPSVRLTVIMANRLPLEQQTGADLIYFQRGLSVVCDGSVQGHGDREQPSRVSMASW